MRFIQRTYESIVEVVPLLHLALDEAPTAVIAGIARQDHPRPAELFSRNVIYGQFVDLLWREMSKAQRAHVTARKSRDHTRQRVSSAIEP